MILRRPNSEKNPRVFAGFFSGAVVEKVKLKKNCKASKKKFCSNKDTKLDIFCFYFGFFFKMGGSMSKPWSYNSETKNEVQSAEKKEERQTNGNTHVEIELPLLDCFVVDDKMFIHPGSEVHRFVTELADHSETFDDIVDNFPEIPILSKDHLERLNFKYKAAENDGENDGSEQSQDLFEFNDEDAFEDEISSDDQEEWSTDNTYGKNANDEERSFGSAPLQRKNAERSNSKEIKNSVIENDPGFFVSQESSKTFTPVELKLPELLDLFRLNKNVIVIENLLIEKIKSLEQTRQLEERLRNRQDSHLSLQSAKDIDLFRELTVWMDKNKTNFNRYATKQNQYIICVRSFLNEHLFYIKENKKLYDRLFRQNTEAPVDDTLTNPEIAISIGTEESTRTVDFFQQRLNALQPPIAQNQFVDLDLNKDRSYSAFVGNKPEISNVNFDHQAMNVEIWKQKFVQTEKFAYDYIQTLMRMESEMAKLYDEIMDKDISLRKKDILQTFVEMRKEDDY
jgi:hypothetical protein